jgi:hypothetical protein
MYPWCAQLLASISCQAQIRTLTLKIGLGIVVRHGFTSRIERHSCCALFAFGQRFNVIATFPACRADGVPDRPVLPDDREQHVALATQCCSRAC